MSELGERLVKAASPHVWAMVDAEAPEEQDVLPNKAVADVLRELAEADCTWDDFRLEDLADEIDPKGEQQ